MEIEKNEGSVELKIKRCYLPFKISDTCPHCGNEDSVDLEENYLSNPTLGEPIGFFFCCSECEYEWIKNIVVDITIKEADNG